MKAFCSSTLLPTALLNKIQTPYNNGREEKTTEKPVPHKTCALVNGSESFEWFCASLPALQYGKLNFNSINK